MRTTRPEHRPPAHTPAAPGARSTTTSAELATAAARLTRRQDEDSFASAARVVVRVLTALHGREKLATLLPRYERSGGRKATEPSGG